MTEEQINAAKNLAAVRALEAYGEALEELLKDVPLEQLDQTEHVHTALIFGKDSTAIAVICHWKFVADPKVMAALLRTAKSEGSA